MKTLALIIVFIALIAVVLSCSPQKGSVSLEERAREIDNSLMCPICPGQTIAESQSALSQQMRSIVREKLAQGATKEEILQFFVERYGEGVLAAPPKAGFNLLLWVLPFLGVAAGGFLIFWIIKSMKHKALSLENDAINMSDKEHQYWEERLKREMDKK